MSRLKFAEREIDCKGIIFDKDCTITDSFAIWPELISRRARKVIEALNIPADNFDIVCRVMGFNPDTRQVIRNSPIVVGSRMETATAVSSILFLKYGFAWDVIVNKVKDLFEESDSEMGLQKRVRPFPGMADKLKELHQAGFILAVATNDSYHHTKEIIELLGLQRVISVLACADMVTNTKPNPDMVQLISKKTGIDEGDFVLVGDSLLDIEMGIQAGTALNVGVTTGACTAEELLEKADCVISTINDIAIV